MYFIVHGFKLVQLACLILIMMSIRALQSVPCEKRASMSEAAPKAAAPTAEAAPKAAAPKAEAAPKAASPKGPAPKAGAAPKAASPKAAAPIAARQWHYGGTYGPAFHRPPRMVPGWHTDLQGGMGKAGGTHTPVRGPAGRPPWQAIRATRPSGAAGGKGAHVGSSHGMPFGYYPHRYM